MECGRETLFSNCCMSRYMNKLSACSSKRSDNHLDLLMISAHTIGDSNMECFGLFYGGTLGNLGNIGVF